MPVGYSGTPLAKKLGVAGGQRTWREAMPESVAAEIGVADLVLLPAPDAPIDMAHIFVTEKAVLEARLAVMRTALAPAGMLWISWPKKAAKVTTDVTEDVIRTLALPLGLVDVKVCAVDEVWSGLKLVIRKALRG
jgi:hypothetical protein